MTSKDITITYGVEAGDCTRPYHITLNRSDITVKEFIDYVLSELKSEWGYIRIYNWKIKTPWDADYEFEYRHGVAKADEVVPSWILASCIKQLAGSGGWSRSDWDIIIEGEEQMTELEKLIEQKKEIERRIKELKEQPRYFGEGEVIKVDKYRRCSGAKEMFRVSAKRMSYNEVTDGRYIALIDVPIEDKGEAIEYLAMINKGLAEYFK